MVRELADRLQQRTETDARWECGEVEPGRVRSSMTQQYVISSLCTSRDHDRDILDILEKDSVMENARNTMRV